MADTMNLDSKKQFINKVEEKSWKKIEEVKEFLDLLEAKIEWEFKHAEALDLFSKFQLNHLKGTPFETICKSMIRKADNESYQTYELVESLKNAVYEPLKEKVKKWAEQIDDFTDNFKDHCKKLTNAREALVDADCHYLYQSKCFTEAINKAEYNSKCKDLDFYDEKIFSNLNSKMKSTDKKAKNLEEATEKINKKIDIFKQKMSENFVELQKFEDERLQAIVSSLHQMNVFQTNWDMNNKYDANNFNEVVDNIDSKTCIEEFAELCDSNNLKNIDTYSFTPFDELISSDDVEMSKIKDEEEKVHNDKVLEFMNKCKNVETTFEQEEKDQFAELMNKKISRFCFISNLSKIQDYSLKNKEAYERLAILVMSFLKGWNKNADGDYLRSLLNVCNKLYYDIEDDDAVIRTHLTEGIRDSKIWDNYILWGKAIFKDFRDIIRKFKIPEQHQKELNKEEILRNVLFNRFYFYIHQLSYFDMNPKNLRLICNKFTKAYKFSDSQRDKLSKKIVSDDLSVDEDDFFKEDLHKNPVSLIYIKTLFSHLFTLEKDWLNN